MSEKKLNGFQVIVAVIKCVVGTGSFFLPQGIAQAGLWGGIVGMFLMWLVTVYLNWIIMKAKIVFNADTYYHLCLFVLGPYAGWLMYVSVIITNVGGCAVYLVTGATLLQSVSDALSIQEYLIFITIFELFISWIPSFEYLSWTSVIGILGLITAMISVYVYGFTNTVIKPISSYPGLVINTYGNFFATVAFLYIQPSTFFPIANATAHPERFNMYNTLAYVVIAIVNTVFGVLGYLFFGNETQSVVLQNLCPGGTCKNTYTLLAQIALFIDVVFTFPLILASAHEILEDSILVYEDGYNMSTVNRSNEYDSESYDHCCNKKFTKIKYSLFRRNIIRSIVVFATYGLASVVPSIQALVGIVSGITVTYNSFIMGPIIHMKWKSVKVQLNSKIWYLTLWFHIFLVLVGIALGGFATYLSVKSII